MNPELRRNLWLQFSPGRLLLAPICLGLVLVSVWIVAFHVYNVVALLSEATYYLLAVLWGTRRAGDLMAEEVAQRTWDAQRMSALGAWQMTWGKLVGGTSYVWYASGIALGAHVAARWLAGFPLWQESESVRFAHMLGIGLLGQAVAFQTSLVLLRKQTLRRRLGATASQVAGLLAAWALSGGFPFGVAPSQLAPVQWFDWTIPGDRFWLASTYLFLAWSIFGAYRLMRLELQFRNLPLGWIGFALYLMVYADGLLYPAILYSGGLTAWLIGPFAVAIALTYVALFAEPKDVLRYRWFAQALAGGDPGQVLLLLPQWLPCFLLAALTGLALCLFGDFIRLSALLSLLSRIPMFASFGQGTDLSEFSLALVFYLLRDVLLVLLVNFRSRRGRADLGAFLCLMLLHIPLPVILRFFGLGGVIPVFAPYPLASGLVNIAFPIVETFGLWWVVRGRLQAAGRFAAATA